MKGYILSFLHRGLIFGGFGPIIAGIVYLILSSTLENFSLSGTQLFVAILSTYLLAFIQAGASIFNQIDSWPLGKSLLCHLTTLYIAYVGCYIINSWIPLEPFIIILFSVVFLLAYLIIWFSVFLAVKIISKKLNKCLK